MGSFSKAFKKIIKNPKKALTEPFKDLERITRRGAKAPLALFSGSEGAKAYGKDFMRTLNKAAGTGLAASGVMTASAGLSLGAGEQALFTKGVGDEIKKRFQEEDGPLPPAVTAGSGSNPASGSGTNDAITDARRRAIAESIARRRRNSTTATSPLGLTGQGAQLGTKRLTGV